MTMTGRLLRSLCVAALSAALAGVAVCVLASGDYAFSPPLGWTKLASGTNMKWVDSSGKEYLYLHPTSYNGDLNAFVNAMVKKEKTQYPTLYVWTNKNYLICGRHTGRYVIWTSSAHGHTSIAEQMMALWGQDGYVITYMRPQNHPPSSVARMSLLSICGVGETVEPAGGVPVTMPKAQSTAAPQGTDTTVQPTPEPTGTIYHMYAPFIPNS